MAGTEKYRVCYVAPVAYEYRGHRTSVGPSDETVLNAQYGTIPRETFYTGRSEDAGLLVDNARTGDGFAIVSEVPGYMKRTEINAWSNPGRVGVMYDTDLMPFERSLAPGAEFKTAAVSLLTFRNHDGFNDPHWVLPSYTAAVLERKLDARGAPWIYNTWEPFERSINRATTLQLIDVAGFMGMDIFTIDDGWQQEYGENTVDPTAFPGGLDAIQKAVEAKGMRLALSNPCSPPSARRQQITSTIRTGRRSINPGSRNLLRPWVAPRW